MIRMTQKTLCAVSVLTLMSVGGGHAQNADGTAAVAPAPKSEIRLRVGVRSQARPFSYKSETLSDVLTGATPGPLARADYTGYMVKICDSVLTDLVLNPPDPSRPLKVDQILPVDVDKLLIDVAKQEAEIEKRETKVSNLRVSLSALNETLGITPPEDIKVGFREVQERIFDLEKELGTLSGAGNPDLLAADKELALPEYIEVADRDSLSLLAVRLDKVDAVIAAQTERFRGATGAEALSNRNKGSRFRYLNPSDEQGPRRIDILCDPASITNERRDGLMISPPLYMTGISFITPRSSRDARKSNECPSDHIENKKLASFLFGVVGNTTAASSGIRALLAANELPEDRDALIQFLRRGDSAVDNCRLGQEMLAKVNNTKYTFNARWNGGSVLIFTSHDQAARAFCDGYVHYYLGDRDIIVEHARTIPGCNFDNGTRTFTADRYAVFGKIDYTDTDQSQLVTRFFEILSQKVLSHPSILDQAFYETFYPSDPTRTLEYFYRSVRGMP